jgi:ArsR family transcriptional regulator, arsenate/arsenite/antimonite-responsive transcriptional repressor
MGASKSDFFTEEQNNTANIFKALAHPARIAIIEHILNIQSCICGDLVDALPLSQSTISQHLRELKQANLIKGTIEGNSICYCLNEETISEVQAVLLNYTNSMHNQNKCC